MRLSLAASLTIAGSTFNHSYFETFIDRIAKTSSSIGSAVNQIDVELQPKNSLHLVRLSLAASLTIADSTFNHSYFETFIDRIAKPSSSIGSAVNQIDVDLQPKNSLHLVRLSLAPSLTIADSTFNHSYFETFIDRIAKPSSSIGSAVNQIDVDLQPKNSLHLVKLLLAASLTKADSTFNHSYFE